MSIRSIKVEDVMEIVPVIGQREVYRIFSNPNVKKQYAVGLFMLQYGFTFTDEYDKALAIIGVNPLNDYTAEVISIISSHIDDKKNVALLRFMCKNFRAFLSQLPYKRLQVNVMSDYPKAQKMIEKIGFKKETELKNYYGDADAFIYSKVR